MPVYCKYCHNTGHNAMAYPASPSGRRVCYRCLERGHLRIDCPLRRQALNGLVKANLSLKIFPLRFLNRTLSPLQIFFLIPLCSLLRLFKRARKLLSLWRGNPSILTLLLLTLLVALLPHQFLLSPSIPRLQLLFLIRKLISRLLITSLLAWNVTSPFLLMVSLWIRPQLLLMTQPGW